MNPVKRRLVLAAVISLSIVAAACSSDSKSATTSAPTTVGSTGTTAGAGGDTTTPAASSPAAASSTTTASSAVDLSKLSGHLVGSGATFPKSFYDDAIATLAGTAPNLTIEYGGGGSGKGRSDLQAAVVDFAGTDGVVKDADKAAYTGGE
ncbi:MAG: phosphate transport system substrate-binding protein, partial [Ilumatobacteraceae bacterium]|nr:phosphate transport system substrate-binding protein [Ilumatobacteraceae bacterium]